MNNYKLLPALNALLQTQSLTEAARILNVTQPAISRTLAQIREAFGDPILVRDGKVFHLTRRAEEIKKSLPALLREMDALYKQSDFSLDTTERRFSIAFDSFVSANTLPDIAAMLGANAPHSSIQGSVWGAGELEALATSNLDLVATMAVQIPEHIYGKRLASDQYVVLCCKHSQWAKQDISLTDYLNAKHVLVSGLIDKTREVDTVFRTHHQQRKIFAVAPSFEIASPLLSGSERVMTVPLHIAAQLRLQHPLHLCALPFDLPEHHYYLLWHEKHQSDPEHKWFREQCFTILKQHFEQTYNYG